MTKLEEMRLSYRICQEIIIGLAAKDYGLKKPRRLTAIDDIQRIAEGYNKMAMEERLRIEQLQPKNKKVELEIYGKSFYGWQANAVFALIIFITSMTPLTLYLIYQAF